MGHVIGELLNSLSIGAIAAIIITIYIRINLFKTGDVLSSSISSIGNSDNASKVVQSGIIIMLIIWVAAFSQRLMEYALKYFYREKFEEDDE